MGAAPAPFTVTRVDHTGITVRDLDASLAFWRDALGFELLFRARRDGIYAAEVTGVPGAIIDIAVLKGPGHKIELLQYLAPTERAHVQPRPCDIGALHLAFDVDDLDAAMGRLAAFGLRPAGAPQTVRGGGRDGTRVVYLHDPDGITLELMQPPR